MCSVRATNPRAPCNRMHSRVHECTRMPGRCAHTAPCSAVQRAACVSERGSVSERETPREGGREKERRRGTCGARSPKNVQSTVQPVSQKLPSRDVVLDRSLPAAGGSDNATLARTPASSSSNSAALADERAGLSLVVRRRRRLGKDPHHYLKYLPIDFQVVRGGVTAVVFTKRRAQ